MTHSNQRPHSSRQSATTEEIRRAGTNMALNHLVLGMEPIRITLVLEKDLEAHLLAAPNLMPKLQEKHTKKLNASI